MNRHARNLWNRFCADHEVLRNGVELFAVRNGHVQVKRHGPDGRKILRTSAEMENLIIRQAGLILHDFELGSDRYEGLVYVMYWRKRGVAIPLYIGRTEKLGRLGGNLSANIKSIESNKGKFARWGHAYGYHIGSLSAVTLPGHPGERKKANYREWADMLFTSVPSASPRLRHRTYLWVKAWEAGSVGIWPEFGPTQLAFLESLLIGVAQAAYPDSVLNHEGVNR